MVVMFDLLLQMFFFYQPLVISYASNNLKESNLFMSKVFFCFIHPLYKYFLFANNMKFFYPTRFQSIFLYKPALFFRVFFFCSTSHVLVMFMKQACKNRQATKNKSNSLKPSPQLSILILQFL